MSYSTQQTDKILIELEKKLARLYNKAYNEVTVTSAKYMASFAKRDEKMREDLKDKEAYKKKYCVGASAYMTPEEHYRQWRLAQIGRGKRWEAVRSDIAETMQKVNANAADVINQTLPNVYKINHDFSAYEIEKSSGIAFDLVNEHTVSQLMSDKNFTDFRTVRTNPKRDYNWNSDKIQNALISGIIQGKSVQRIADSFMQVMGTNKNAAIRNARTAVTSAQAAGCNAAYKQAESYGIEVEKEWIATNDGRTRDSHRNLDGVRVPMGETFPNGCEFPADPVGHPREVYNCRCTMRAILPQYNGAARTNNTVESYNKWLESKIPLSNENIEGTPRTKEEFIKAANKHVEGLEAAGFKKSKWNNELEVNPKARKSSAKIKDKIVMTPTAEDATLIHELLHTMSAWYYNDDIYAKHRKIEEATVAYATKVYGDKIGIKTGTVFDDMKALYSINKKINYGSDLDFAIALINEPLPQKTTWLIKTISDSNVSEKEKDALFEVMTKGGLL